ncbi:MAG TPA: chemotaxis protein CheB, partial [bacterium]
MFKKAIHKLGYFGLLAAAMLFIAPAVSANEVIRWNQIATAAAAAAETDPLTESRIFTILHVAIHDAANAIDRRYDSYRLQSLSMPQASVTAAIAAAAHTTLTELMPGAKPTFDAALKEVLHSIPNGDGKTQGLQVGREAALAILAERKNDGANRTVTRAPGIKPGEYRPTPPDLTPAFLPQWGEVTPFALRSSAQFRPGALPAVNSPQAIADLEEVKAIGAEKSPSRTAQQSEIARYWYENSTQGWNRIARAVLEARQLDEWENARLFALVNMAMADG